MKLIKTAAAVFSLSTLLLMSACQKDQVQQQTSSAQDEVYDAPEFIITDVDALESPSINDPDETQELAFPDSGRINALPPCQAHPRLDSIRKARPSQIDPKSLPFILRKMQLDSAQRHAIRGFLADHCDCIADHIQKVQEMNRMLLHNANMARYEAIQSYRNNRISRADLLKKLQDIRMKLLADLRDDQSRKTHMAIIRDCRARLFHNIESVLTTAQLEQWHRWLDSH